MNISGMVGKVLSFHIQSLEEVYGYVNGSNDSTEVKVESCNWFNVIVDFIFRELRDSPEVKRSDRGKPLYHYTMIWTV